jgi:hypothetical protein
MDQFVLTKENLKELKTLKLKQYQTPQLLSSEDEATIKKFEHMKYSGGRSIDVTPSQSKTPTSDTTTDSTKSQYAVLVEENRQWRNSFSKLKLSDYDKEMEKNSDHFNAAANHNAPFLLFVRFLFLFARCLLLYLMCVLQKRDCSQCTYQ